MFGHVGDEVVHDAVQHLRNRVLLEVACNGVRDHGIVGFGTMQPTAVSSIYSRAWHLYWPQHVWPILPPLGHKYVRSHPRHFELWAIFIIGA